MLFARSFEGVRACFDVLDLEDRGRSDLFGRQDFMAGYRPRRRGRPSGGMSVECVLCAVRRSFECARGESVQFSGC